MSNRLVVTLERNGKTVSWTSEANSELTWDLINTVLLSEIKDVLQKKPELLRDESDDS